jgi:hypothetical protein
VLPRFTDVKWDLKRPCKACPFRPGAIEDGVIRFACRERAEEIEESAYRNGFVCHEHATYVEGIGGGDEDGYTFGEDGEQHCVGALLMYMDGGGNVPFEHLDEDEQVRIQQRLDWEPGTYYMDESEFLDSYGPDTEEN